MVSRIAVLTPSRERPQQCYDMIESIAATALQPVDVYVGVDHDDPYLDHYVNLESHFEFCQNVRVAVLAGDRMQLGPWTNKLAQIALTFPGVDYLVSFGDDHRCRTPEWDRIAATHVEEHGLGLVYGRDGLQDENLPTAPIWSAEIIRALGWYFFPGCKHLYADNMWKVVADAVGRRFYLPEIEVEHLHPSTGKVEADDVNRENDSYYGVDGARYTSYIQSRKFSDDLNRVMEVIG